MTVQFADYNTCRIRFRTLPENGLLLYTSDICSVLEITDRPAGSVLSTPYMDLASAVIVAGEKDIDFAMWLNETFASYNLEQQVHPQCDDDWKFTD